MLKNSVKIQVKKQAGNFMNQDPSSTIVSFNDENLILVDKDDSVLGYKKKDECHEDGGILHRAFSIFIFNDNRELLLQKRSRDKLLWPLFWSNSCCSHPRQGETVDFAVERRLQEELGIKANVRYVYKFQYQARFKNIGSENELCYVFFGFYNEKISYNSSEIDEIRFIKIDDLTAEIAANPAGFTPWFKMEWEKITGLYLDDIPAK